MDLLAKLLSQEVIFSAVLCFEEVMNARFLSFCAILKEYLGLLIPGECERLVRAVVLVLSRFNAVL